MKSYCLKLSALKILKPMVNLMTMDTQHIQIIVEKKHCQDIGYGKILIGIFGSGNRARINTKKANKSFNADPKHASFSNKLGRLSRLTVSCQVGRYNAWGRLIQPLYS